MDVFVINLHKSTKRLVAMTERLNRLELPFTRISAVYGLSLTDDELNRHYSSELNKPVYRRSLIAALS